MKVQTKKLKLRKGVKYLLLFVIDLIVCITLKGIMKDPNVLSGYRFNLILVYGYLMANFGIIAKIEGRR